MRVLLTLLFMSGFVIACNDQAQKEGGGRRDGGQSADSGKNKGSTGKKNSTNGSDDGDDDTSDSGNDSSGDDKGGEGSDGSCNFKFSDKLASPVSASGKASAPIIGAITFNLEADAEIAVSASSSKATVGLDATITTFSPSIARSIADNVINSYKDPLKLTVVPESELKAFYDANPEWKKVKCMVVPVTRVENKAYEYEFEPALPMIVSPKFSADELKDAIGGGIDFGEIKSKLVRHFQPESVAKRGNYTGSASLSASGGDFQIEYDFGTKAPEALATPMAGISFVVADKSKFDEITITSFVADDSKVDLKVTK